MGVNPRLYLSSSYCIWLHVGLLVNHKLTNSCSLKKVCTFILFKHSLSYITVLSHVHVVLLGEGGAVSACPVSVPHSPGEGVYRAGSRPRGRTGWPGGWLRGGWRGGLPSAGAEGLYSLFTRWGCSGQGCHEVRDGLSEGSIHRFSWQHSFT